MHSIRSLSLLAATSVLLLPSAASAKKGGGEGADPAPPPPVVTPCVNAVGQGSGVVHGNKGAKPSFELTNCSTADETLVPHFSDHAIDAWGLGRDCGPDQAWDGAPLSLKAGKSVTLTTFAVRAACPSAESHTITLTFTTPAGGPVSGIGYFGWSDAMTP